jgi:hypothetical protein
VAEGGGMPALRRLKRRNVAEGLAVVLLLASIAITVEPSVAVAGPWGACGGQEGSSFDGFSSGFWKGGAQPEPNEGVAALLTDAPGYDLCSPTPQIPPPEGDNSISQWVMVQSGSRPNSYVQAGTVYYYGGSSPQGQLTDCVHLFVEMNNDDRVPLDNYSPGCSSPGEQNQAQCEWLPHQNDFYCSIYDTASGDSASLYSGWYPMNWGTPYWIDANAEIHFWQDTVAGRSNAPYLYGGSAPGAGLEVQSAINDSWYDACGHVYLGVDQTSGLQGTAVKAYTCDQLGTWESD